MLVIQEDPDGEHQENVLATGMVANSRPRDNMTKIRSPRARPSPPQFFTMLAAASEGRMVTNPGGVLIRTAAGDIIGAVGISGDTSDRDEACAIAGIEAAGLKADPGQDAS